MYVKRNNEAIAQPLLAWKSSITYSEHVLVALVIRHAMRMRHIVNCGLQYFSTLSHKRQDLRRKVTEHKMCVLIVSTKFYEEFSELISYMHIGFNP